MDTAIKKAHERKKALTMSDILPHFVRRNPT
jgi:hypothetical protein